MPEQTKLIDPAADIVSAQLRKTIVEAPNGKRYVFVGCDPKVVFSESRNSMTLQMSTRDIGFAFALREIKRDPNGRKLKEEIPVTEHGEGGGEVNETRNTLGGVQLWEGGPFWAECNLGASKPEDFGYHFMWGSTEGAIRSEDNQKWQSAITGELTEFSENICLAYRKNNSELYAEHIVDNEVNLEPGHDAATALLGAPWRMPTDADFKALVNNCGWVWTRRNGVYGMLVTGRGTFAAKSIFLPAAGYGLGSGLYRPGSCGSYWSSSPGSGYSYNAWGLCFGSGYFNRDYDSRYSGQSVRPLRGFAK